MVSIESAMTEQTAAPTLQEDGCQSSNDQTMALQPQTFHTADKGLQSAASMPTSSESEVKDTQLTMDTNGSGPATSISSPPSNLPAQLAELVMEARRDFDVKLKALLMTSGGLTSQDRNDFYAKVNELHAKDTETISEWEKAMLHVNIALGQLHGRFAWTEVHENYSNLLVISSKQREESLKARPEYNEILKMKPEICAKQTQIEVEHEKPIKRNLELMQNLAAIQNTCEKLWETHDLLMLWVKDKPEILREMIAAVPGLAAFVDPEQVNFNEVNDVEGQ
ncbi:hypothetical protein LTR84_006937 [Exophiala bonariae]|uniref:Uncharacterized protein n=1 Tax=Exophiala bonariae TaxID=1690606 RepID=A0AAV9N2D1_9EURO|nr:hypothetical protein LTR84_006937 [Exophiala bonariae]